MNARQLANLTGQSMSTLVSQCPHHRHVKTCMAMLSLVYLHWPLTWFEAISMFVLTISNQGLKEGRNVLFNDTLNTFYLRLYGVRHMVNDHSDSERGNPLPPHRLLFPISSKGSFICTIPDRITHIPQPLVHQSWSTGTINSYQGLKKEVFYLTMLQIFFWFC